MVLYSLNCNIAEVEQDNNSVEPSCNLAIIANNITNVFGPSYQWNVELWKLACQKNQTKA